MAVTDKSEYYSVVYFKCITTFEGLKYCIATLQLKVGLIRTDMRLALDRRLMIQHGEVLKIHDCMIFALYAAIYRT